MCNPITLITTRSCTSFSLQLDFLEHPAITDIILKRCDSQSQYTNYNALLHILQLDFLEHPAITDVVVCSVVLEEVRHKNSAAYQRLRALCASDAKRFFVFANEHHRWGACTSLSQNNQNEW
jgi:hypothetical protein